MISHTVLLTWKPGITDDQVEEIQRELMALPSVITEIDTYRCGPNCGPGESNANFAVVATFATLDEWKVYDTHPEHSRVRADLMAPWIASRSVIQFSF